MEIFQNGRFSTGEPVYQIGTKNADGTYDVKVFDLMTKEQAEAKIKSMGVKVEGVHATEAIKLVNDGKFDKEIAEEKTEISAEEQKKLEEERKKMAEELAAKREQFEKEANAIIKSMEGKDKKDIRGKLKEAKIPQEIIDELVPADTVEVKEAKETPK